MTREDIIETYMINSKKVIAEMLHDTIERYESRTCENCHFKEVVFNKKDQRNTEVCKNYKSLVYKQYHSEGVMNTFGCPAFERKDK